MDVDFHVCNKWFEVFVRGFCNGRTWLCWENRKQSKYRDNGLPFFEVFCKFLCVGGGSGSK